VSTFKLHTELNKFKDCERDSMEKDILVKYKMNNRDEAVKFLKSLWLETPLPCPLCNGKLDYLHKKAKKSNCDWICTACGERYDTIKILDTLNER